MGLSIGPGLPVWPVAAAIAAWRAVIADAAETRTIYRDVDTTRIDRAGWIGGHVAAMHVGAMCDVRAICRGMTCTLLGETACRADRQAKYTGQPADRLSNLINFCCEEAIIALDHRA